VVFSPPFDVPFLKRTLFAFPCYDCCNLFSPHGLCAFLTGSLFPAAVPPPSALASAILPNHLLGHWSAH
jgi:hypothetical protein